LESATVSRTTGSQTLADLFGRAVEEYGNLPFAREKVADAWVDTTFAQAGDIVTEIGLGLMDLGLAHGERLSILAQTRPEWTYCDLAASTAGLCVVPIYPTNSPQECAWVLSDSEAVAVICEDAAQVAKVTASRDALPELRHIIVIDPQGAPADTIALDELRRRGRALDAEQLRTRAAAVQPQDTFTIIYTSGTTGSPKGCVLSHRNYRRMCDICESVARLGTREEQDVIYLFLPLAHSFALLIQLLAIDIGCTIAYASGDSKAILAEIGEVRPTYLPSVPRIFEKLYTLAQSQLSPQEIKLIREVGGEIEDLRARGEDVPAQLIEQFAPVAPKAAFVQSLFGGRLHEAVTGAAPISTEILEFFWGAGVPVLEAYGMTETSTSATYATITDHRFGTVGKPYPGVEIKIADDGEILISGDNIFGGYYRNDDASFGSVVDGWLHTGDLGSIDPDGYVSITGRKKDIIITAGGKNLTPANIENEMKQTRWVSQAVMHGDRRPYPVMLITLDEEEIAPWARERGVSDVSMPALARDPQVIDLVQGELSRINQGYAQVEQVKRFFILDHDLSQATGELTPTMKVKRNIVNARYADHFDALYQQ
jgi:long-chain acyl-CoA synthetase